MSDTLNASRPDGRAACRRGSRGRRGGALHSRQLAMDWHTTSVFLQRLESQADQRAWEEFLEHFETPLLRFARRAGLGEEDARDATQDTLLQFVRAYRGGRYDRRGGRLRAWLFAIARNKIVDTLRRQGASHAAVPAADLDESIGGLQATSVARRELERTWDEEWERHVYERCIERLRAERSDEFFSIFRAFVLEDCPADQVAARLGVSRSKVYNVKYRAVVSLRAYYHAYEQERAS